MIQQELARAAGVFHRIIASYESVGARVLKVSVKFLTHEDCTNPLEDIEKGTACSKLGLH